MAPGRARRGAIGLVVSALLGLTGCVGAIDRREFDDEIRERGGGLTSELLAEPLDRLRAELGVEDPELLLVSITPLDRFVLLEVRDPDERGNVDRYISRNGTLADPEPVRISARDDLDARTFRVSDVPALDDLEGLADEAIGALGFTDAYVEAIASGLRSGEPVLSVQVASPRAAGSAIFDADGELLAAERS